MTTDATPVSLRVRLALAALAFVACGLFAAIHEQVKPADFYVFWAAARHASAPYDPAIVSALKATYHVKGAWPFAYPPTFLLFVWPFALAPVLIAYPLWTAFSAGLFAFAASAMVRPAWACALLLIAPPVVLAVSPGQTSLLVGAAMIGGFSLLEEYPRLAGVLFAVAVCIKPQAMILAPLVLWGRWATLGWILAVAAALAGASLVFGLGPWLDWPKALLAFHGVIGDTERVNPSALFDQAGWSAAVAVLGVYLAVRCRDLAGLVAGGLCLTPYAHQYDLAPLAPLAAVWLLDFRKRGLSHAAAGAALLAGFVSTPLAGLAFAGGLAAIRSPWLERIRSKPPPAVSYEA